MIGRLIIPVIDTERYSFETDLKLTADQYREMVYDNFRKNDGAINRYMTEGKRSYTGNGFISEYANGSETEIIYEERECECLLLNVKKAEITEETLNGISENNKMCVLLFNINPNDVDEDAESEIRFWIDDSQRVLRDESLDDIAKIKFLPKRTFKLLLENKKYEFINCKMIENRSDDKFPYYFAVMIEKII